MRNLKKIVSLALALMMVLSLMVTASAVDFADADSINPAYEQAVEVMVEAGILNGTGNGFEPTKNLDRASAAKLVAYLATAGNIDGIVKCETVFTDVPAAHWASGYIGYCYDAGVVNGNSATTYNPTGYITVESYAKLLLGVLKIEGTYTGDMWYVAVRNNAVKNGLMTGMTGYTWTANITREEAAQMTFNAMKAGSTFSAGYWYFTQDNQNIKINEDDLALYIALVGSDNIHWQDGDSTGLFAQFGITMNDKDHDKYGAPATSYTFDKGEGKDDVTLYYPAAESVILTKEYTAKELATALKGYTITDGETVYKVEGTAKEWWTGNVCKIVNIDGEDATTIGDNGVSQTLSSALANLTGNNAVVRIYADAKKNITDIVVTNTYINVTGKVTAASKDGKTPETIRIASDDVDNTELGLKEGTVVTFTMCKDKVENVAVAEYIVGTLSSWNSKGEYTINGETYTLDGVNHDDVQAQFGKAYAYYLGANNTIIKASAVPGVEPEKPVIVPDGYAMVKNAYVEVKTKENKVTDIWTDKTETTVDVTATVMLQVVTSEGELIAYSIPVEQAAKNNKLGLTEGDYYVTIVGETYKVCDKNGTKSSVLTKETLLKALSGTIYTYVNDGEAVELVAAAPALSKYYDSTVGGAGQQQIITTITANTLALTSGYNSGKAIVLLSDNTVFVLKSTDKDGNVSYITKTTAELENTTIPSGSKLIINVSTDGKKAENNVYTAAVVFAYDTEFEAKTEAAKPTEDLVYIASGDFTVSGLDKNGKPVYTYTGIALNGNLISITSSEDNLGGIYVLMSDGTIGASKTASFTEATITTAAAGKYILSNGAIVTTDKDTVVVGGELAQGNTILYTATKSALDVVYVIKTAE